jgi:hypothetical protein
LSESDLEINGSVWDKALPQSAAAGGQKLGDERSKLAPISEILKRVGTCGIVALDASSENRAFIGALYRRPL